MELVHLLTQQLGIDSQQASGGLGLLMGVAKEKLGGKFSQVAQTMPGIESLIQQAPQAEGAPGAASAGVGGALSALGGLLGDKAGGALSSLGTLATLAGGYKQLGLGTDSIGRFIPVILGFVQNKGGDTAKNLLAGVLN
jgi:hypothetical protein